MNVVTPLLHLPYRLRKLDYKSSAARVRTLRIAVEAILGVAIVVQGTFLGLQLARLSAVPTLLPVIRPEDLRARRADSPEAAAVVAAAHLFGIATAASAAATSGVTNAAPTRWVLTGTIAARQPGLGLAILGDKEDQTHLFAVGEQITADYQLAQVYSDRVTLMHAGEPMTVRINRSIQGFASGSSQPAVLASRPQKEEVPAELAERPENFILADALLQPAPWIDASGKYAGITLLGKMNSSTLKQYGFKAEDVITAVNGHPITSLRTAQKALKEMSQGVPAAVTVVRNGTPEQMSVTLLDDGTL